MFVNICMAFCKHLMSISHVHAPQEFIAKMIGTSFLHLKDKNSNEQPSPNPPTKNEEPFFSLLLTILRAKLYLLIVVSLGHKLWSGTHLHPMLAM